MLTILLSVAFLGFASSDIINCAALDCFPMGPHVCGNDGNTYSSGCAIVLHNCWQKDNVKVAHNGPCGKRDVLDTSWGGINCAALDCFPMGPQVCGNDGNTYSSGCAIMLYNCWHKAGVKVAHSGPC
ncbi:agrin-like [Liolophura sinensis]|uniref:agrin-like n=1 Tax=Liolophura sinensis TaxID=3198878 RepID=UPI0031590D90